MLNEVMPDVRFSNRLVLIGEASHGTHVDVPFGGAKGAVQVDPDGRIEVVGVASNLDRSSDSPSRPTSS